MKRIGTTLLALAAVVASACAQGASNIKINEVLTVNEQSIQDEYGKHLPWVELVNTAYSTYNVRGMYITSDRSVLDKSMSAPERMKRMSIIPSEDKRTNLSARQHIVFYLQSTPAKGALHLSTKADPAQPLWIALYDGNGVDLIDSVTVPVMKADCSYARRNDGAQKWEVKAACATTPGIENFIQVTESKIEKMKKDDPYGIGMTLLCMGIVFAALALLYVFFVIFGFVASRRSKITQTHPIKPIVATGKKLNEVRHATSNILQDGLETKGRDKEIYIAVIAMALRQYADDVHDLESGKLTIKPHHSSWDEHNQFNNIR